MIDLPHDPAGWFAAAAIGGALCASLSLVVVLVGWRRALAEVVVLGAAMFGASVMTIGHALGGVAPASQGASRLAAALAAPLALAVGAPLSLPHAHMRRWFRAWRRWVAPSMVGSAMVAATLSRSGMGISPAPLALFTAVGAVLSIRLVVRQTFLFRVSRRRSAVVTAVGTAVLFGTTLASPWTTPGSPLAWVLLAVENAALLLAAIAMLYGYRTGREVADILQPLLSHDPFAALDVGMAPEVEAFVRALGAKDVVTRDHVRRTSSIALRAATRVGLPASTVREVAIGALLHDIGKLVIPSEIIGKPSALTDAEYATIKTHPEQGERLLGAAPSLAAATKYVRWHHERPDGCGYPDGLHGDDIPLEVGIVSAADAWDAMTNTRQYRTAMPLAHARDLLLSGAGTQWHPAAVQAVLDVAGDQPSSSPVPASVSSDASISCLCDHDTHDPTTIHDAADEPSTRREHSGSIAAVRQVPRTSIIGPLDKEEPTC